MALSPTIVICSSMRFADQIAEYANTLRKNDVIVLEPARRPTSWDVISRLPADVQLDVARGRTYDHFRKIEHANAVLVFNAPHPDTKKPYVGVSTTLEIGYSVACGKPVYALSLDDPELCRSGLFLAACPTPHELLVSIQCLDFSLKSV